MPTPTGLPKAGEVWSHQVTILGKSGPKRQFVVLSRSGGDFWSMNIAEPLRPLDDGGRPPGYHRRLMIDCAYSLSQGWLKYIGPAGPKTRKELGLG